MTADIHPATGRLYTCGICGNAKSFTKVMRDHRDPEGNGWVCKTCIATWQADTRTTFFAGTPTALRRASIAERAAAKLSASILATLRKAEAARRSTAARELANAAAMQPEFDEYDDCFGPAKVIPYFSSEGYLQSEREFDLKRIMLNAGRHVCGCSSRH